MTTAQSDYIAFTWSGGLPTLEQAVCDGVMYKPDPNRPPWEFVMSWGGSGSQQTYTNTGSMTDAPLGPGWWLSIHAHTWDSTTGEPMEFVHNLPMWLAVNPTREEIFHEIARLVVMVQTHEVLEFLQTAAGRICDPHGGPAPLYHLPPLYGGSGASGGGLTTGSSGISGGR